MLYALLPVAQKQQKTKGSVNTKVNQWRKQKNVEVSGLVAWFRVQYFLRGVCFVCFYWLCVAICLFVLFVLRVCLFVCLFHVYCLFVFVFVCLSLFVVCSFVYLHGVIGVFVETGGPFGSLFHFTHWEAKNFG